MRFWLREPLRAEAGEGEGGGGTGSPALTADAISKLISDGVNAALNGYDKKIQAKLKDLGGRSGQQQKQGGGEEGDPDPDPDPQGGKKLAQGGVDPEVAKLRKQLEQTNKRLADQDAERAREKEAVKAEKLDAAIRKELAKATFIDDEAFESAYARLAREVRFSDDGSAIVGGSDDTPLAKYAAERIKKWDFLLKPKDVGGAGAANGGRVSGDGEVDMESIKPGMTPEEIAKVKAKLASLAPTLRF
ncbi:MAG: hypothetical protein EPO02_13090 [Nitrospirae bacterium]|nr:MAG: hypothetical protein EPO02_13090 [Nitrospirota bacterium]